MEFRKNAKLRKAASKGDNTEIERLLNAGADINKNEGMSGFSFSPLQAASHKGHLETVRLLVTKGATVDGISAGLSCENGHKKIVQFFVDDCKLDPNTSSTVTGNTLLNRALLCEHLDIARFLLERGATPELPKEVISRERGDLVREFKDKRDGKKPAPVKPEEKISTDIVLIETSMGSGLTLSESFNFQTRERISVMIRDGALSPLVRESFDKIENQVTVLTSAFEKYKAQGGTLDESVIRYHQKNSVHLPGLAGALAEKRTGRAI